MGINTVGPTNGLIGYWKFDNESHDWGGSRNDATLNGVTYDTGIKGMAGYFDGTTTNDIEIGTMADFKTASFSISIFAKLEDWDSRHLLFVNWGGYTLEPSDSSTNWRWRGGILTSSGQEMFTPTDTFSYGVWYQLGFTFDDVTKVGKAYVNGTYLDQTTFTGSISYDGGSLKIGHDTYGSMKGWVDEARYYDRALSDEEMMEIYNFSNLSDVTAHITKLGTWETKDISEVGPATDFVGYWRLDDNALDMGGNRNDGTVYGTPTYTTGIKDKAISFNGSTQYVNAPVTFGKNSSLSLLFAPADDVTTGQWISRFDVLSGSYVAGANRFLVYRDTTSTLLFHAVSSDSTVYTRQIDCTGWNGGEFHHIVFNLSDSDYDSSMSVYIDGLIEGSALSFPKTILEQSSIYLGRNQEGSYYCEGLFDDVRIYDDVLSTAEIKILYNTSLGSSSMELTLLGETYLRGKIHEI